MKFLYTLYEGGDWCASDNDGIVDVEQLERMVNNEDNWTIEFARPMHASFFRTRIGTIEAHAIQFPDGRVWDSSFRGVRREPN